MRRRDRYRRRTPAGRRRCCARLGRGGSRSTPAALTSSSALLTSSSPPTPPTRRWPRTRQQRRCFVTGRASRRGAALGAISLFQKNSQLRNYKILSPVSYS
uniref:Uncharacterized protein n=1 Tax=Oryza rufipogon TaxID=4529 RepID=A0A0E0NEI2_ORYRU